MTEHKEPLFIQYLNTEPIKVDPADCKTVADLIEKAKKKFAPELNKLTLHEYTGTKLGPGLKITELIKQSGFENSVSTPLLIRYVDVVLPVNKETHTSENRKRWNQLNPILIEVAANNKKQKEGAAYSSLTWKLISPIYKLEEYFQPVKEVPSDYLSKAHRA